MKDVLVVDPDLEEALPLDPFGSRPQWKSMIAGLGGTIVSADPTYVFLTPDCRPAIGTVTVSLYFHELVATCGTLLIELRVRSAFPGSEYSRLQTIALDLRSLAASKGRMEFSFESYRNAYYAIAGNINDRTDVTASHIAISIDRRATSVQHGREWGWRSGNRNQTRKRSDIASALISTTVTDAGVPSLDAPQSQAGTPMQCRERGFLDAMTALRRAPAPTAENWSAAYILQAMDRFAAAGNKRMLAYLTDETDLLSYFAAQEHEIMGMLHMLEEEEKPDPGYALRALFSPGLCDEAHFFAHAHLSTGDIRFPPPNFHDQFDVTWSIGANRAMAPQEFVDFVVASLINAKPGGLAVHVFDYVESETAGASHALTRQHVERMAILALSHGNDIAKLRFSHAMPSLPVGSVMPFGVVLLRGGPQG